MSNMLSEYIMVGSSFINTNYYKIEVIYFSILHPDTTDINYNSINIVITLGFILLF